MKDDRLYLHHIAGCIEKILDYCRDGREAFLSDARTQDAVLRNFEVMGEAAKRVSPETRRKQPDIAWRRVAGFRDVLIHQYEGVDMAEVWKVIEKDLPGLRQKVESMLEQG